MTEGSPSDPGERSLRERAVERIKKKDEFRTHVLAYVLVNAFLVVIWAVTGSGLFWLFSQSSDGGSALSSTHGTSTGSRRRKPGSDGRWSDSENGRKREW